MVIRKDVGIIEKTIAKKTYEEEYIEWRIADFSTIAATKDCNVGYESPDFIINDVSWFLRLRPISAVHPEFMRLIIMTNKKRECPLNYNISLKKADGSEKQLTCGILEGNETFRDVEKFIKISELLQRKSELTHQNALTIVCKLKREIAASGSTMPLKLIQLDTLSENFKDLMSNAESCDTTLHVQDKEYRAHRTVLIARSSVFAAMFLHDTSEKQTGVVNIPDCDPESFGEFLKFLYCAKLEKPSYHCALHLYATADKYAVQELKTFCVEFLKESLTVENVCSVAIMADKYEETDLLNATQAFFNKNANKVLQTAEWDDLVKKNYRLSKRLLIEISSRVKVVD